jgi:ribulose-5-phosphate 4-epimerase/fuculose-1-phosphate aldolase
MEKEGVVKYTCHHVTAPAPLPPGFDDLLHWRGELRARNLIGEDAAGIGYGNLSIRVYASPRFVITGSQSSGLLAVDRRHFAEVTVVDLDRNRLRSLGDIPPSSEALTHASLYQVHTGIRAVVHVHAPALWDTWKGRLPTTYDHVEYGTPEMGYEMIRLHKRTAAGTRGCFVMGGHRDGIIAFGQTMAEAAGEILRLET